MLAVIIDDKESNCLTHLYIDDENNISGFSVKDNKLMEVSKDIFNAFNVFKLGSNNEVVNTSLDFEVILDKDTGFYHFFKDGKEDIDKLFMCNGEDATLYSGNKINNDESNRMRKFKIKMGAIYVSSLIFSSILVLKIMPNTSLIYKNEQVNLSDAVSYFFNPFEEDKFVYITSNDIKEYIYNSNNINDELKAFLWNENLINDVIPYYNETPLSIISKVRHLNISVETFNQGEYIYSNSVAYYSNDNVIHIRVLDKENMFRDQSVLLALAHEYIHLLQSFDSFKFVKEASAEIISHEYFFQDASTTLSYSYWDAVKYLKVLMEIIGPDSIFEDNFKTGSTAIVDAVKPYLNDKDFDKFISILNYSPFYDDDKIDYKELENILSIIYTNKYNKSMYDDDMINAIINNCPHSRPYFNQNIINESYYYEVTFKNSLDLEHAMKIDYVIFQKYEEVSEEVLLSMNLDDILKKVRIFDDEKNVFTDKYMIIKRVSIEEYLNNYNNDKSYEMNLFRGGTVDFKNMKYNYCIREKREVISIKEKFNHGDQIKHLS